MLIISDLLKSSAVINSKSQLFRDYFIAVLAFPPIVGGDSSTLKYNKLASQILSSTWRKLLNVSIPIALYRNITKMNVTSFIINVNLIGEKEIALLNEKFYSKEKLPTDILTFPYYQTELWGELFICPVMAKIKGNIRGESFEKYMQRLLIHGLLHLFFGDHSDVFEVTEEYLLSQL